MRFCISCGKELTPGKKFCEYCGAPVEQSPAPAAPAIQPVGSAAPVPQVVPAKPSGGSGKTLVVAGIVVVVAIIAVFYFVGLPLMNGSPGKGPGPQTTAIPTPGMPQITAFSTVTADIPMTPVIPAAGQTYEEKYTETYNQVYSVDHAFVGGQKEVFTQDLTTPPLYIKFNITPKMYFGEKTVDIGLSSERVINTNYTSPNAWFKVRVYDAGNGGLIEEQGFNKEHSIMTKQEFMVRAPGNYRVEMTGNDVVAEVRILTGKS
jgi:hypothetical protein